MTSAKATPKRGRKPSLRPCVFREAFVREQIDPRVKEIWARHPGGRAPFGRLRKAFQQDHCSKINFYTGSECPYRVEECAMAFLSGVQNATLPWIEDPAAYFVKLVASTGITRADEKPLAREHHREQAGSSDAGSRGAGTSQGRSRDLGVERGEDPSPRHVQEVLGYARQDPVHSPTRRPEPIGDLLGALNLGPRPRDERDGRRESEGEE